MVQVGADIYLQLAQQSHQRILHPGSVTQAGEGLFTVEFDETDLSVQPGQEVVLYYDHGGRFSKQSARVSAVLQSSPHPLLGLQTTGPLIPADSRQAYRVSTAVAGLAATVGTEDYCPLQDVSPTGLAVLCREHYAPGKILDVQIIHEGRSYRGRACILSIRELGPRQYRYGMHCVGDNLPGENLQRGLQQISLAIQRMLLRRRTGQG